MQNDSRYTVIIPTLNAARQIERLIRALRDQTRPPEGILIVDSQSGDDTVRLARSFDGVEVMAVRRGEFDHGTTRDIAVRSTDAPYVVLMTQDALPMDEGCMEALLAPLEDDEGIAAVCGRQVAYPDATAREKAIREYRYPAEDRRWSQEDIPGLGMRAFLLSDTCSAYRRDAYEAVGGFAHGVRTNEDMLIAADFLKAGYKLAYQGQARVRHSHNHSMREEYFRNYGVGAFLETYADHFAGASDTSEGMRLVRSVVRQLIAGGRFWEILPFGASCAARLLGNRRGRRAVRRSKT